MKKKDENVPELNMPLANEKRVVASLFGVVLWVLVFAFFTFVMVDIFNLDFVVPFLAENEGKYSYSLSDENGLVVELDRAFCTEAEDGGQFCFSWVQMSDFKLTIGLDSSFVLGEEIE